MPNLRLISRNVAQTALTLVASTVTGAFIASRLQNNTKTSVWRATGTSATLTLTWSTSQIIGCTSLAFCNFTPSATMRVRGYTEVADVTAAFDTTAVECCPAAPIGMWDWGADPLGVNAFTYGGGTYGTVWNTPTSVKKIVIDIVDTGNSSGYVEAGCLVTGMYWQPTKNADYGASIHPVDNSKHFRSDSGNQKVDNGTKSRTLSIALSKMEVVDRTSFWSLVRGNGTSVPVFVSLYPEGDDPVLTQMNEILCRLPTTDAMSAPSFGIYSSPLKMDEI